VERASVREGSSYRDVTGSSGRRPWIGLCVAVAVVAIALVKPWAGVPLPQAPESALPRMLAEWTPRPASVPLPPPTAAELARASCPGTMFWMVHSFQRRGADIYNVWTVTEPVAATGADLAAISYTPIFATQIMAFGYCAPGEHELRPRAIDPVEIWRVGDGNALMHVPTIAVDAGLRPDFGALLGPTPSASSGARASGWPAGRYLIRVGGAVLGAEIVIS
jgi:hypothetical protein